MKSKESLTRITWLSREKGGRLNPPSGGEYSAVARFKNQTNWPSEAWSVMIRFLNPISGAREQLATVRFLVDEEAPDGLLDPGVEFELMEGPNAVARVKVLEDEFESG